jgi:hypothetical protein
MWKASKLEIKILISKYYYINNKTKFHRNVLLDETQLEFPGRTKLGIILLNKK